jgi:hypothetical protein
MTGLEKHRFLGFSKGRRKQMLQGMSDKQLLDILKGKDFEGKDYIILHAEGRGIVEAGKFRSSLYPVTQYNPKQFWEKAVNYDYQKRFRL